MNDENASSNNGNYFEGLFNNSHLNGMVIMDTKGYILSVNKAFTASFGYTAADITGENFAIFFTDEDQNIGKPQIELRKAVNEGQADDKNFFVKKDKTTVWVSGETVLVRNSKNKNHLLKIIQDISDQKEAESALRRTNDLNESILTTIDDIVILLNKDLNIIKVNQSFYSVFKQSDPVQLINDFRAYVSSFDQKGDLLSSLKRIVETGQPFTNLELGIATLNGDRVFNITGRSLYTTQRQEGVLLVIHEITIQKQAEREREDIIGFVAHELRNPLSNVILCNEMLKEIISQGDMASVWNLLQRSQNNIFRLNKMITNLYDATKINSGNFILEISTFDFDEMIEEAIDTVQVLQPAFNITASGKGGMVRGDRHRLIQVVTNYMSNGIKYSNGDKTVAIEVSVADGMVTVAVKDKGLGISAAQLPHIFDRFFRAEKTKNLEGIGLGLFLCRRIIDAHGGKVWASSAEGKGSVFYFAIPVA